MLHRPSTGTGASVTAGRLSLRALLERPVMARGIRLGAPGDAVLDSDWSRVVGLEVVCSENVQRFLPLAAARIRDDHVAVGSPLLLLGEDQREFYRRGSRPFRSLIGAPVVRDLRRLGELVDLHIGLDGTVVAVSAGSTESGPVLHARGEVTIVAPSEASAA